MKQKMFTILLVVACLAFASSAFAATITGNTTIGNSPYSPSFGVTVWLSSQIINDTSGTKYIIQSVHSSGTALYCTIGGNDQTADYSKIYRMTGTITDLPKTSISDTAVCPTTFSPM